MMIHRAARVFRNLMCVAMMLVCLPAMAADQPALPESVPANAEQLLSTLTALKADLDGSKPMTDDQIKAAKEAIDRNAAAMGANDQTIRAAFDVVGAYDEKFGPLWVSDRTLNRGGRRNQPPSPQNDIHWTIFNVMQDIMDHVYTPENVANHRQVLEGFKFACSEYFPGPVADMVALPGSPQQVKIDASYVNSFKHQVLGEDLPARRPTGFYAPPGGYVRVTLPQSIVNKGYQIRVGAHSWDNSNKPVARRLNRVTLVYPITSEKMQIANPLGGGIYIEVPRGATAGVVEVGIVGAVPSPFFCSTPYHKTTNAQWKQMMEKPPAPWADFQSEKFLMQVPTCWVTKLEDPEKLMADWDKAMTIVTKLMGIPDDWGREVEYLQVDLQNRGSAFFPGYPTCNDRWDPKRDYEGWANNYLVRGPQSAPDYPFHEMGHGFMFTKYPGDREAAVNLLTVAMLNQGFGVELEEAFRRSRGVANEFCTLDTTAITWMMNLNFLNDGKMTAVERQYQLKGHAKYVDVVRLFGWQTLDKLWGSITQDEQNGIEWSVNNPDSDKLTIRLSKVAGADLRPLIAFWGIPTEDDAASDAAIKANSIPASAKVYDLLVKYKELVPKDNAAFRAFALKWWGHEPKSTGFTTERNHADRWEHYNQAEAEKVRQKVQSIIDRYFPNGRPK